MSPWFWEKMHCAASDRAELARWQLDYNIPGNLSLVDWRAASADACAGSLDQRQRRPSSAHPSRGYSSAVNSRTEARAPVLHDLKALQTGQLERVSSQQQQEPPVTNDMLCSVKSMEGLSRRPSSAHPSRGYSGAVNSRAEALTLLQDLSALQTGLPQRNCNQQQEPPSTSDMMRSVKSVEGLSASTTSHCLGARNRRQQQQDASVEEARMLLQRLLVQPDASSEMIASQSVPVVAAMPNPGWQEDAAPDPMAARLDRLNRYDGLETAMNRLQSGGVRQLLSKRPATATTGRKDSSSAASTRTGSTVTSAVTSPSSRRPSKETLGCDPMSLAKARRFGA